jgi:hypothetical protein
VDTDDCGGVTVGLGFTRSMFRQNFNTVLHLTIGLINNLFEMRRCMELSLDNAKNIIRSRG